MEILFSIIGSIIMWYLLMLMIGAIFTAVCTVFMVICEIWEKLNSLGRAVIFGIPLLALSTTIFYLVIWHLIPILYDNWIIVTIASASGFYVSTWFTGFIFDPNMKYKIFSRAFSTAPFLPIILLLWIMANAFGKLFLKDFKMLCLIKLWNPNFNNEDKRSIETNKRLTSEDLDEDPEIRRLEDYLRVNGSKMNALEIVEVKRKIASLRELIRAGVRVC